MNTVEEAGQRLIIRFTWGRIKEWDDETLLAQLLVLSLMVPESYENVREYISNTEDHPTHPAEMARLKQALAKIDAVDNPSRVK